MIVAILLILNIYFENANTLARLDYHTKVTRNKININSNQHYLFQRTKRQDNSNNECYKFIVGDKQKSEFFSPGYPEPYPANTDCFKVIEARYGMVIKVEFRMRFELEDHDTCDYDYLEVRDGKYGYSRLIGKFCRPYPFPEIISSTRYLWFHFHSDSSIQGDGFRAFYSFHPRPAVKIPDAEECIFHISGLEFIISSLELEKQKKIASEQSTELDCIWNITVPEGYKVYINKLRFIGTSQEKYMPFSRKYFSFFLFFNHSRK